MSDNENARLVDENQDGRKSGWRAGSTLTDRRASARQRARRDLDRALGIPELSWPETEIDYHACGLDLGWPERVAAGIALRERAA